MTAGAEEDRTGERDAPRGRSGRGVSPLQRLLARVALSSDFTLGSWRTTHLASGESSPGPSVPTHSHNLLSECY